MDERCILRLVEVLKPKRIWEIIRKRGLFLMPLIILVPEFSDFLFPASGSDYTDILVSHYPNAIYLINSVRRWWTIPLWSDNILGGYPFIANPLSGLWYPIGYLAYLLPLPLGFNILMAGHLIWGGIGLSKLLKNEGVSESAAYFGGAIFTILPKLFAHISAGHLSLIYAISWTPWVLLAEKSQVHNQLLKKRIRYLPGLLVGLVFLADPRWVPYAGGMWAGYLFAHSQKPILRTLLSRGLATSLSALIVTAPVLLPFVEYIRQSTRVTLSQGERLIFSLSPANLAGMIYPDPRINHEWITYFGGGVFILSVSIVITSLRERRIAFWAIAFSASLFLALGEYLPLGRWLSELPMMNLLRIPPRALFITGFSACALASHGFNLLLDQDYLRSSPLFRLSIFGLSVFSTLLLLGIGFISGSFDWKITWGLTSVIVASIWINGRIYLPVNNSLWIGGMMFLLIADWGMFARLSYIPRSPQNVFGESEKVAGYLVDKDMLFRAFSPSYSLPQQTAAKFNLHLSDGVDPLQLSSYVNFMIYASGVPRTGYSVTVPEFSGGNPKTDNREFDPDPILLGRLNVAYVLSEFDLDNDGLLLETRFGDTRIYKNLESRPRSWVQPTLQDKTDEFWEVESIDWRPNQIEIVAEGPGILILSEIAYPGWKVLVDGQPQQLLKPYGLLRGVHLEPGRHQIFFIYRPKSLYFGISLSIVGLLSLLGYHLSVVRK